MPVRVLHGGEPPDRGAGGLGGSEDVIRVCGFSSKIYVWQGENTPKNWRFPRIFNADGHQFCRKDAVGDSIIAYLGKAGHGGVPPGEPPREHVWQREELWS